MPTCKPTEYVILKLIYRHTVGFNRKEVKLSYKQISKGTGVKGKATISRALNALEDKGYITRRGVERGSIWYGLNQDIEVETGSVIEPDMDIDDSDLVSNRNQSGSEIKPDTKEVEMHLVSNRNQSGSEIEPEKENLVPKLNTYKERYLNKKEKQQQHVPAAVPDPTYQDPNPELTTCTNLYRNNIGPMNAILTNDFSDLFNGLSPPPGETKEDWIKYAVLTASANGKNRWAYVKAIINGISDSGSLQNHKELWDERTRSSELGNSQRQVNGSATTNGYHLPATATPTPGDTPHTGIDADTEAQLYGLFGR